MILTTNEIHSIGGLASAGTLREFARQSSRPVADKAATVLDDQVEISELASFLSRLAELPEDRARRIVDIRQALQDGTFVTDKKLDIATERLLEDLQTS